MNNIIESLKILFREVNSEQVLNSSDKINISSKLGLVKAKEFVALFTDDVPLYYTNDEAEVVHALVQDSVKSAKLKLGVSSTANMPVKSGILSATDILYLPLYFADEKSVLTSINQEPICRYEHLLNWRMISYETGEDLFTTAFLASEELWQTYKRQDFDWRPLIKTDNERLTNILSKGLAENHYHLKGSSPHFDIAWFSLMNQVTGREKEYESFFDSEFLLSPKSRIRMDEEYLDMRTMILIAANIRYFFFNRKSFLKFDFLKYLHEIIRSKNSSLMRNYYLNQLQEKLNAEKMALNLSQTNEDHKRWQNLDYWISFPTKMNAATTLRTAQNETLKDYKGNRVLSGERRFMYEFFQGLYKEEDDFYQENAYLFYAYQLIKLQFRSEFVQLNNHVGFDNFNQYQDRKSAFIPSKSVYEEALYNLAINSVMKDQNLVSLECRIAPQESMSEYHKTIKKIDNYVENKEFFWKSTTRKIEGKTLKSDEKYFYTIHFIKDKDKNFEKIRDGREVLKTIPVLSYECRNQQKRLEVKKQAEALFKLRESNMSTSKRILAIDAANSEIGCRPEVFAQVFRYLRASPNSENTILLGREIYDRIGMTFHAGEDFIDIVDGLRAIDESIRFLGLTQGDRIGHALALGIVSSEYYHLKRCTLPCRKQDVLDNSVWLLAMMRKFGIEDQFISEKLRKIISDLHNYIYGNLPVINSVSPELLYDAWKLRGDDPEIYQVLGTLEKNEIGTKKMTVPISFTKWQNYQLGQLNHDEKNLRERPEICYLNYLYHYNADVKLKGYEAYELKVDERYIRVVESVQYEIQKIIAKKNIGIETNPSSNYVIGTFKRYSKHPIVRFNNYALNTDAVGEPKNLQLFVSINTDDQGVFATYLENEYALMALALEKEKDKDGNLRYTQTQIYEWLDKIRMMGIEQSFINRQLVSN